MNIALVGYGKMGKIVQEVVSEDNTCFVVGKDYSSLFDISEHIDCIIDFSSPSLIDMIVSYASLKKVPCVIGTTGYSIEQEKKILDLSLQVPVVKSANFSLGITLINKMLKVIVPLLTDDFDIEIQEIHHNKKVDSPSGSACMFLDTINKNLEYKVNYGRKGEKKREKKEIGVHSLRGGSVAGEHEIYFFGEDEVISLKHQALSKKVFALGAYQASKFIISKKQGLYSMEDVLRLEEISD
ncbi:MAG: 4-hydroxy-tetrahydrodipicolinate reductase [Bacilli bacterium]